MIFLKKDHRGGNICWNFVQGKLLKVVSASLDLDVREKSFTDSVK